MYKYYNKEADGFMKYYYAKIYTVKQNLSKQIELFESLGGNEQTIFEEKKSITNFGNRKTWEKLMKLVKQGDIIVVKNLDRLGDNIKKIRECIINLSNQGIMIESIEQEYLNSLLKEKLRCKSAGLLTESLLDSMLDTILEVDILKAEWEKKELRKRQKEGIKKAKERGQHIGRYKEENYRKKFIKIYPLTKDKDNPEYINITKACEKIGCSRPMFYKMLKEKTNGIL